MVAEGGGDLRRLWQPQGPLAGELAAPVAALAGIVTGAFQPAGIAGQRAHLVREVQDRFALEDSRIVDQQQLKGWSSQVFERTFAATAALNSLTLGVAGVALFISLLTQSQSRLGQLAPLWALGVTRRQLMLLNLGQTWLLAVLTLVLALPLGLLLAWCLDVVINVQAFGWRLPLQIFPWQLAQLLGLAMLATLLASAWPLWQLYRSRPADLLRTFANED